jgi:predicted RNase H-like HicB family nuclease
MVPDAVTRGTAATREEAMAKFRAAWECHIRATWEKKSYLTADNQMSRRPNLALNAEIEAVVHWTRNN